MTKIEHDLREKRQRLINDMAKMLQAPSYYPHKFEAKMRQVKSIDKKLQQV